MTPPGFPHSDISGSKSVCASPKLFAACHVLHRFPEPRHPPCALCCLTSISSAPQYDGSRCRVSGSGLNCLPAQPALSQTASLRSRFASLERPVLAAASPPTFKAGRAPRALPSHHRLSKTHQGCLPAPLQPRSAFAQRGWTEALAYPVFDTPGAG